MDRGAWQAMVHRAAKSQICMHTYPWYDVTRMTFYLHGLSPKKPLPQLIMRKIPDKSQLRCILWNAWPGLLKLRSSKSKSGICRVAQETQTGALYQPRGVGWGGRWEGGSRGRSYMYTYGWFMLRFDRKQQNSVKQVSFNKKINLKNKQKNCQWRTQGKKNERIKFCV